MQPSAAERWGLSSVNLKLNEQHNTTEAKDTAFLACGEKAE
jgi:hypothetical protein